MLGGEAIGQSIVGGVLASPFVGIAVGRALQSRFETRSFGRRSIVSLISLYAGALMFGLAVGAYGWITARARSAPEALGEGVVAVLYGTTLFVIALWPLAYVTHLAFATDAPWWRRL